MDITHTYPAAGIYTITFSDVLTSIGFSGETTTRKMHREKLLSFTSTARNLHQIIGHAFDGCVNLAGCASFPCVTEIVGNVGNLPFEGCTSLSEIRFAEANRAAIEASEAYQIDPRLGAVNARVTFG